MSRENVDRVREAYASYEREGVEGLYPYFDPEIEWDMTKTGIAARVFLGEAGVRQFFDILGHTWEGFWFRYDQFLDAGDDVLALGRFGGRARGSGVELDATVVHTWTLRDGLGVRLRAYLHEEEALADVPGLEREAAVRRVT